ncbi:MAG: hypothetical protein CO141_02680 [Candidatus Moranbacteria bacterium CG_4_9_14_3_um_filter_42_9]|nr:MAG: hypothetical protein CO141_02680 [Candidatus Moranbacteria bacterium CG_4_9_14_3_um_filter_42_9]
MGAILERFRLWLLRYWLGRNLANIISVTGFVGAYLFLFYFNLSITEKLTGFITMVPFDWADGKVARWLGVTNGAGKVIDPIVDKLRNFLVLYFLFLNPELVFKIVMGLISLGEIAALVPIGSATCLAFKYRRDFYLKNRKRVGWKGYKSIFKYIISDVMENWSVNQDGKTTMGCYGIMFGLIVFRSKWMERDELVYLYLIFAVIGFYFRYYSFLDYRETLQEWQNGALARATEAG